MNRTEFIIAIALILFLAFVLGWFASWLVQRFSRVSADEVGELEAMASALHDAEEQRDQAITYLQYRENELVAQVQQTEAELKAAMEGLGEARREAGELRGYIEKMNADA